jgi:DNA-binding beta-propeller fold protein YncE
MPPAKAAPFAYIANPQRGTVEVIDVATRQLVARIFIGDPREDVGSPFGVTISADGKRAYVATFGGVVVLDTAANTITTTIPIAELVFPGAVEVTPDGKHVYVTNQNGRSMRLDTVTNKVVAFFPGGTRGDRYHPGWQTRLCGHI